MASQFGPEPLEYTTGGPMASQLVSVRLRGSWALANLYSDAEETTAAENPVMTDVAGNLTFFAEPGYYDLVYGTAEFPIVVGSPGGSSVSSYTHVQTVPAMQWVINWQLHLGFRPAGVILVGPDGEPYQAAVYYDGELVLVDHAEPTIGAAHLS